jgi:NAD(P)-dependent dehydrogenase (short-subunit alcohol dehydrogenase family)
VAEKVIIFGGTGDLGIEFARISLNMGLDVTIAARKNLDSYGNSSDVLSRCKWVFYDFENDDSFSTEFTTCYDVVINCIGVYSKGEDIFSSVDFELGMRMNFGVLREVADFACSILRKGGLFLNISSIAAAYGSDEEFNYSSSKVLVDKFMRRLSIIKRSDFRVVNIAPGAFQSRMTRDRSNFDSLLRPSDIASCLPLLYSLNDRLSIPHLEIFRR